MSNYNQSNKLGAGASAGRNNQQQQNNFDAEFAAETGAGVAGTAGAAGKAAKGQSQKAQQ